MSTGAEPAAKPPRDGAAPRRNSAEPRSAEASARLPDVLLRVDRQHRLLYVSSAAEPVLGIAPAGLVGRTLAGGGLPHEAGGALTRGVDGVFEAGKAAEVTFSLGQDGVMQHFAVHLEPEPDDAGAVQSVLGVIRDVSGEHRAANALSDSQQFLRHLAETIPGIINVFDLKEGRVVYTNRAIGTLLGYSPDEVVTMADAFHKAILAPEFAEGLPRRTAEVMALADGEVSETEARLRHRDGSWRWFTVRDTVFSRDPDGSVRMVLGVLLDITERKRAEESLRDREERLRLASRAGKLGVWDWDLTTGVASWTDQAWAIFAPGQPQEEGTSFERWQQCVHPDDLQAAVRAVEEGLQTGTIHDLYRVIRPDGALIWVESTGEAVRDAEGNIIRITGTVADVTEREQAVRAVQESEARFRLMADSAPALIWTSDAEGRITFVNRYYESLFGTPAGEMLDSGWRDIVHAQDAEAFHEVYLAAFSAQSRFRTEVRVVDRLGEVRWLRCEGAPRFDAQGTFLGYTGCNVDISEAKRAELDLRDTALRLSLAQQAARIGDWSWDIASDTVTFSDLAAEIFGIPPGRPLTRAVIRTLQHPDDAAPIAQSVEQALTNHSNYDIEYRVRRPDGGWRWVASSGRGVYGPDGQPTGMLGVLQDVNERKESEAALRESEEQFRSLFEQSPLALQIIGTDGFTVQINPAWERLFGFGFADLEGYNMLADPQLEELGVAPLLRRAFAGEAVSVPDLEYDVARTIGVGGRHWLRSSIFPVRRPEGAVAAVVLVHLEVTESKRAEEALRESEERYRLAARATSDAIWDWDLPTGRIDWSPAVAELFGWAEALEGTEGDWFDERVHPDDRGQVEASIQEVLHGGAEHWQAAYRFRRADGSYADVLDRGYMLRDAGGAGVRMVGAMLDVSELRRVEHALREREQELRRVNASLEQRVEERTRELARVVQSLEAANREMERRNRELQEFAYVASHDLQEPLRKVITFSDMLRTEVGDGLTEQGGFYMERVQNAAARMSQLIKDLLAFSRAGSRPAAFERVNLGSVLEDVLGDLEIALREAGATVEAGALCEVEADATQMRQLLQNLIGNALKFRKPDVPPVVKIRAESRDEPAGLAGSRRVCVLEVEDNGIGFEEKYLERIFIPFQRLHGKQEYAGTGIGLAICRRIAERHGGDITARSAPGEGATFIVTLPVSAEGMNA